jgi:hypothetical protein
MATIKIRWTVDELVNVMSLYDVQKVYRATSETGTYTEITTAPTRVVLAAGTPSYYFDDTAGDSSYWYKVSYYHSTNLIESGLSVAIQGSGSGYATLAEIRAAGVDETQADDATVIASIALWQQFIDEATGQWFYSKDLDFKIDGTDAAVIWLKPPIISVSALYVNGDFTTALNSDYYVVYNNLGDGVRDDRKDPKITSSNLGSDDLFTRMGWGGKFVRGRQNQRIVGSFGYVEPDGSTPKLIKRAVQKMVVKTLQDSSPLSPTPGPAGPIIGETTDGHTVRYASMMAGRKLGTIGITGDAEVEAIIQMYRSVPAMAVV